MHSEIVGFPRRTLDNAIRIGELIIAKKAKLAHGEYAPWLKENVNFGPDAAERYRRIYERRNELPLEEIKTITQALTFIKKLDALGVQPKRGVKGRIGIVETNINPEEEKEEDSVQAEILESLRQVLVGCRGWRTKDYYQLLVALSNMISREMKEIESKGQNPLRADFETSI